MEEKVLPLAQHIFPPIFAMLDFKQMKEIDFDFAWTFENRLNYLLFDAILFRIQDHLEGVGFCPKKKIKKN